jgi:uncharacterized protein (TIGR03000 family)
MSFAAHAARSTAGLSFGAHRPLPWGGSHGWHHHHPYYGWGYYGWHHPYQGWGAYYPSYGGYASSSPFYYNPYPNYGYYPYDNSYSSWGWQADAGTAGYDASGASASPAQFDSRAHVTITVPDNAKVWFDGPTMTTTGRVRQFVTGPLTPGRQYTFWARALWIENGREVNQLQAVEVTAGGQYHVRFPAPARTGG